MNRTRATVDPSISALRVELLGRFMVSRTDVNVPETGWRLGKARSLVKLLALAPGCRLHREQVIDLLWPELDFEDGANNLHQVLHVARRTLAPLAPELQPTRIVRLQQQMLALEGPDGVWVDAVAFEHLAAEAMAAETTNPGYAAVELYRGDLLPEDLYEDWAAEPREALRRQYLAVLLRLAALHEVRREATPAIDALRRVVAAEPTHEEAHVGLMRLYALTGRRQQALRQFERLRELLERELAAKPDPITVELNTAIQAGHYPAEVWPAAPPAPAPRTAASAVHPPVEAFARRSPDFVNREVELRTLREALGQALSGAGQVVFIAGEPGIGKTRLIEELARYAHTQQVAILWGRSYHDAGEPAYWPWVQILREHLRNSSPDEITADFGAEAADLARITPELRRWFPELPEPPRLDPEQERFRLFDSVSTVLTRMAARQPLLLVLDDLHWADRSSLLLLEYVAGPLTVSRLLVVGAYRHIEVDRRHPLIRTLAELSRQGMTHRIDLQGLDEQAVGSFSALTAGRPAPDGLSSVIHEQTNGNPFFVKEIVQLLLDEERFDQPAEVPTWRIAIPRGIRETMALRRDRLSDNANQVLSIAAVVGRDFGLDVVSAVSARPTIEVLEGLEESLRAGLLTEVAGRPGTFHFVHAIGRQTLYDELSHARRVTMHHQIGEAIEQLHAANLDQFLPELALHFRGSAVLDGADKAVDYLRRAARQAFERVAYSEAAQFAAQALELTEQFHAHDLAARSRLLLQYGEALTAAGDSTNAQAACELAAQLFRDLGDARSLAQAAIGVFEAGYYSSYWYKPYVDILEEGLAGLSDNDADLKVRIASRLATALQDSPEELDQMQRAAEQAVRLATEHGLVSELPFALYARYLSRWNPTQHDAAVDQVSELIAVAAQASDTRMSLMGHAWRTFLFVEAGDFAAADLDIAAYGDLVVASRLRHFEWAYRLRLAMRMLMYGPLAEAEQAMDEAQEIGLRTWPEPARANHVQQLFYLRRLQGRSVELIDRVRELIDQYPDIPIWRCMLANLFLDDDRVDEAHAAVRHVLKDGVEAVPKDYFWLGNLALLAEACARIDAAGDLASALFETLAPFERRFVSPGTNAVCLGPVSFYLGLLARSGTNAQRTQAYRAATVAHCLAADFPTFLTQLDRVWPAS